MESFIEYCKNYIIDHIEDYEGQSHYACDWGSILTDCANCDGTLTYSTEDAKEYLKEWWYDCGQYFEYEKSNFGSAISNPFENPEAYMVRMVCEGVNAIFTKCPTINEMWNDNVEMTEELINEIKEVAEGIDEDEDLF